MRKSENAYAKARRLRREMSLPERLLWRELKGKAGGVKFRKQHPVGPFVLDFYCAAAKLGIEIDGIAHDMGDRSEGDSERDEFVRSQGIEVVRYPATEVLASAVDVAEAIIALCAERMA